MARTADRIRIERAEPKENFEEVEEEVEGVEDDLITHEIVGSDDQFLEEPTVDPIDDEVAALWGPPPTVSAWTRRFLTFWFQHHMFFATIQVFLVIIEVLFLMAYPFYTNNLVAAGLSAVTLFIQFWVLCPCPLFLTHWIVDTYSVELLVMESEKRMAGLDDEDIPEYEEEADMEEEDVVKSKDD